MRDIAHRFSAILGLALSLGCGDDQLGPSADGPPFFTATIDGQPWSPEEFAALLDYDNLSQQAVVILQARRNTDDGGTETLSINFFTSDPFSLTSYPLDTGGAGEAAGFFDTPNPETSYSTDEEHRGTRRITGANTTDSVVSGVFAFAGAGYTGGVRQFRGEFRVRYTTSGF